MQTIEAYFLYKNAQDNGKPIPASVLTCLMQAFPAPALPIWEKQYQVTGGRHYITTALEHKIKLYQYDLDYLNKFIAKSPLFIAATSVPHDFDNATLTYACARQVVIYNKLINTQDCPQGVRNIFRVLIAKTINQLPRGYLQAQSHMIERWLEFAR